MSSSPQPQKTTVPKVPSLLAVSEEDSPSTILAPKPESAPKVNVTSDSQDLTSLVSSVANAASDLSVSSSKQDIVMMISGVLSKALQDLNALPDSPKSTTASDPPHQLSVTTSSPRSTTSVEVPVLASAVPVPIPTTTSPSTKASATTQVLPTNSTHPFTNKLAVGPPSDPLVEAELNFVARKNFRDRNSLPVPAPFIPPQSVDHSPLMLGGAPALPSGTMSRPRSFDMNANHHARSYVSGGATASNTFETKVSPFLAPNHHDSIPKYSPKPMITFDVSKWTKEINGVTIDDESYDAIISWYDLIQQAMIIATGKQDILPDIQDLTKSFSFPDHLLPASMSSVYKAGCLQYASMAKALRIYLTKPATISTSCTVLAAQCDLYKDERDGFFLLLQILGSVFPHLGGPHLDIVSEISSIKAAKTETFQSLLRKFTALERKLSLSGHYIPPTALFQRYMDIIKCHDKVFSVISPILRSFFEHLDYYGPDVKFPHYTMKKVHRFLRVSGIDQDSLIGAKSHSAKNYSQAHSANFGFQNIAPQACAANFGYNETQGPQEVDPQAHAASMAIGAIQNGGRKGRSPPCPVCFQRHPPLHCWARGVEFQPIWLRRNVEKYNALHKHDVIEDTYKDQSPPLRQPHFKAQANKSVTFVSPPPSPPLQEHQLQIAVIDPSSSFSNVPAYTNSNQEDVASVISHEETHMSVIQPTCNMAIHGEDDANLDEESFLEA